MAMLWAVLLASTDFEPLMRICTGVTTTSLSSLFGLTDCADTGVDGGAGLGSSVSEQDSVDLVREESPQDSHLLVHWREMPGQVADHGAIAPRYRLALACPDKCLLLPVDQQAPAALEQAAAMRVSRRRRAASVRQGSSAAPPRSQACSSKKSVAAI